MLLSNSLQSCYSRLLHRLAGFGSRDSWDTAHPQQAAPCHPVSSRACRSCAPWTSTHDAAMLGRAEFSLANLASASGAPHHQPRPSRPSPRPLSAPGQAGQPAALPAQDAAPQRSSSQLSRGQAHRRRARRHQQSTTASAAAIGLPGEATLSSAVQPVKQAASDLYHRSISGCLLGLSGAAIILAGGWVFTLATCALVYQISQEFFGFVTSKDISEGMLPPPPLVSALTSLSCICLTIWMHLSAGRSTAALAVSSFVVLSLQLLAVERPHFSQISSAVFGLFYCGACCPAVAAVAAATWSDRLTGMLRCRLSAELLGEVAAAGSASHQQQHRAQLAGAPALCFRRIVRGSGNGFRKTVLSRPLPATIASSAGYPQAPSNKAAGCHRWRWGA